VAGFGVSLYHVLLVIEPSGIIAKTHYSKPCLKYPIVTLTESQLL
jgi:hypothetical protein